MAEGFCSWLPQQFFLMILPIYADPCHPHPVLFHVKKKWNIAEVCRVSNNFCRYLLSRSGGRTSSFLEEEGNVTTENPDQHYLKHELMANIDMIINHVASIYYINHEIKHRGNPTEYLVNTPQNCPCHLKQQKSERLTAKSGLQRHVK